MINFYSENEFQLQDEGVFRQWLFVLIASEGKDLEEISFIFCDDVYLLKINQQYLQHDFYTDIISFDNSVGNILGGDIFISTERISDNAKEFKVDFKDELLRVMAHGILHLCGYKDKSEEDSKLMRQKEEEKMKMFHVEQ